MKRSLLLAGVLAISACTPALPVSAMYGDYPRPNRIPIRVVGNNRPKCNRGKRRRLRKLARIARRISRRKQA